MTESDFSVNIDINFSGSIWNFWEQNFSRELEEAWERLERLRVRQEDYGYSETSRREAFLEQKMKIRILWTVTDILIKEQQENEQREHPTILREEFMRTIYYSAILNWCSQYFHKKYGFDIASYFPDFKRALHLQIYNTDDQEREELMEDGRLEELWNRFGSHKLPKVKFVWAQQGEN